MIFLIIISPQLRQGKGLKRLSTRLLRIYIIGIRNFLLNYNKELPRNETDIYDRFWLITNLNLLNIVLTKIYFISEILFK